MLLVTSCDFTSYNTVDKHTGHDFPKFPTDLDSGIPVFVKETEVIHNDRPPRRLLLSIMSVRIWQCERRVIRWLFNAFLGHIGAVLDKCEKYVEGE